MKPKHLLMLLLATGVVAALLLRWQAPDTQPGRTLAVAGEASSAERSALGASETTSIPGAEGDEKAAPTRKDAPAFPLQGVEVFAEWLISHKEALSAKSLDAADLAEGVRWAKERRPVMREWMQRDPQAALEGSLKWHEWLALPQEIQAEVEEPFSARANFIVYSDCRPKGERDTHVQTRFLEIDGERYDAFVYGRRWGVLSKENVPLQGITLDGVATLWESPVYSLDEREQEAARVLFDQGATEGVSWVSGEPAVDGDPTALIGGNIYHFASAQEMETVEAAMAEAEQLPGPKTVAMAFPDSGEQFDAEEFEMMAESASLDWTTTPKSLLVLRVIFSDQVESSHPYGGGAGKASLETKIANVSAALNDMSYEKTSLAGVNVPEVVLQLSGDTSYYAAAGRSMLVADTKTAAAAYDGDGNPQTQDIDENLFDWIAILHPYSEGESFALAVADGRYATFNGVTSNQTITHELGHNYGLGHANGWYGGTGGFGGHKFSRWFSISDNFQAKQGQVDGASIEHDEYGAIFDSMGGGSDVFPNGHFPNGHFAMSSKVFLNWIEASAIWDVQTSGIYRVYQFDHVQGDDSPTHRLALKVDARGETLWAGLRGAFPNHQHLQTGAYLVWENFPKSEIKRRHRLIDTTPQSVSPESGGNLSADFEDAPLAVGKSYIDPTGTVRITNLQAGGSAPNRWIDLEVTFLREGHESEVKLFTDSSRTTPGLVGSYVNDDLAYGPKNDWRSSQTISGSRIDPEILFLNDGWGLREPLELTGGTDEDWANFAVQWDGILVVEELVVIELSDLRGFAQMYIDLNGDQILSNDGAEYFGGPNGYGFEDDDGRSSQISAGVYAIRIQFSPGYKSPNTINLGNMQFSSEFELFADEASQQPGLKGSYFNSTLANNAAQEDWVALHSADVTGERVEYPGFMVEGTLRSGWGERSRVGVTSGTDDDWDQFSVQWDGWIEVNQPVVLNKRSAGGWVRMWVDLDHDGSFGPTYPEFVHGSIDPPPADRGLVLPGRYRIRIQYSEAAQGNQMLFFGTPAHSLFETWVDFAHTGTENGQFLTPFNTIQEGADAVRAEGRVRIKAGTSTEPPLTLPADKTYFIEAFGGEARVGQ